MLNAMRRPSLLLASRFAQTSRISPPPSSRRAQTRSSSTSSPSAADDHDFGRYSVILPEEPYVFGTAHIAPLQVPDHIPRPPYVANVGKEGYDEGQFNGDPWEGDGLIALGAEEEDQLRSAAKLATEVLEYAGSLVKPGITTSRIDAVVHQYITAHHAYPSPLLYSSFPKSICTSVNNIIVHGIPDDRPLELEDLVNIDITVYKAGYHGDTSATFPVSPHLDRQGHALTGTTSLALQAGISACGPGRPFTAIGRAIHAAVAAQSKETGMDMCINTQFTGHGIGRVFHRPPWIMHHLNDEPGIMRPGHCFTIEPAIIQGRNPRGWVFPDGWSASTCSWLPSTSNPALRNNSCVNGELRPRRPSGAYGSHHRTRRRCPYKTR
ncbi:Creatinase/aminopeptidase [Heliocybe sulcata]|uniref:Methionine aminopeptidase n=1 Tax=Heliocybe sulcata TaxID=5364 RepID=A0A5C3MZM4_9AGAM|nr:Creatinase/aminopeptidase [Heliocybe sulcata]